MQNSCTKKQEFHWIGTIPDRAGTNEERLICKILAQKKQEFHWIGTILQESFRAVKKAGEVGVQLPLLARWRPNKCR